MEKLKLVSVIIPVYNAEKYIVRCIESVLQQTYKKIEFILINDGSTDNSALILNEYQKKDKRIRVIHKENAGVAHARNIGLEVCMGEYLLFLDSDDFLEIKTIERWVDILENDTSNDILVGNYMLYYGNKNSKEMINSNIEQIKILNQIEAVKLMLSGDIKMSTVWGKLFRKKIFDDVGFPIEMNYGEDMVVMMKLLLRSRTIILDNYIGYFYSQEGESLVRSGYSSRRIHEYQAAIYWKDIVYDKFPELQDIAFERFIIIMLNQIGMIIKSEECEKFDFELRTLWNGIDENYIEAICSKRLSIKNKIKILILKLRLLDLYKLLAKNK